MTDTNVIKLAPARHLHRSGSPTFCATKALALLRAGDRAGGCGDFIGRYADPQDRGGPPACRPRATGHLPEREIMTGASARWRCVSRDARGGGGGGGGGGERKKKKKKRGAQQEL